MFTLRSQSKQDIEVVMKQIIEVTSQFSVAFKNGWCYLCQRKVGKCEHTKPCEGCKKMWINCICISQKGKKK